MATDKAQYAPYAVRSAEERYAYMLLHAPGGTGKEGEPVRGGAWLQEQMRILSGAVPGLDADYGGSRVGALGPGLSAVISRGEADGLVSRGRDDGGVALTPRGRRVAGALWEEADQWSRDAVARTKRLINDMGYWELVPFACTSQAGAEAGAEDAGEFGRRRLGAAVSLARRHRVSIIRAAAIAGMETEEFEAELRGGGIDPYYTDGKGLEESMKVIDRIIGR